MLSKLKIIVDYPCDVVCDNEYKGHADIDGIFVLELRKGIYFLQFKVSGEVMEAIDYHMDSSEQDDLLRITLLTQIKFSCISFERKGIQIQRDINSDRIFYGDIFVKTSLFEKHYEIGKEECNVRFFKNKKWCEISFQNNESEIYKKDIHLPNDQNLTEVKVDVSLLHYEYGEWNGKFIIYTNDKICIYGVDEPGGTIIDNRIGYLYSIDYDLALTYKDDKFGLFDIGRNAVVCGNIYDELFCSRVEEHGYVVQTFLNSAFYTIKLNGKFGIIDSNGKELIRCEYDEANPCAFGFLVKRGENWGLSRNGEEPNEWFDDIFAAEQTSHGITYSHFGGQTKPDIIEYSDCPFSRLLFFKKGAKYGYWHIDGRKSKTLFDAIETDHFFCSSVDRLLETRVGNKYGCIDCYGQEIIPCQYDEIKNSMYLDDVALFCDNLLLQNYGIKTNFLKSIENEAKKWNQTISDYLIEAHTRMRFIAKIEGKYGVVTIKGEILIPFLYDAIEEVGEDAYADYAVEKNGLFGVVGIGNKEKIPFVRSSMAKIKKEYFYLTGPY